MIARISAVAAACAAITAVAVAVIVDSSGNAYRVRAEVSDAHGLFQGVQVRTGGVKTGEVAKVELTHDDRVFVDLDLDEGPIGRDATITITPLNLLGQQTLVLNNGDVGRPLPSGSTIPLDRVKASTDLQQVLNVLDPDTRTRLQILIYEAGTAFAGRRIDFNQLLRQLPGSFANATQLLDELVSDNHSLARVVANSDNFVARITDQRQELNRVVDTLGQASNTFARRHEQLQRTLADAPPMLAQLQDFLGSLRTTTHPLGAAARVLRASAAPLAGTLAQLPGFERAARSPLQEASDTGPLLTQLADRATPVLRRANPTAASLAGFSTAMAPATAALNGSIDNLLASMENWSHAVVERDGIGHFFRGAATLTPDALESVLRRFALDQRKTGKRSTAAAPKPAQGAGAGAPRVPQPKLPKFPLPPAINDAIGNTLEALQNATDKLTGKAVEGVHGATGALTGKNNAESQRNALLDYLLTP